MNQIISILNSFKEIITFENITFLLGLIGSAGTAWQVIQSRRKIHLSLPYFGYSADRQLALAYIQFDNLSNSAISITDISIVINGITYPCDKSGYGGSSGYFVFQIPSESAPLDSTCQLFLISSSRGSSFRVELKPDQEYFSYHNNLTFILSLPPVRPCGPHADSF